MTTPQRNLNTPYKHGLDEAALHGQGLSFRARYDSQVSRQRSSEVNGWKRASKDVLRESDLISVALTAVPE